MSFDCKHRYEHRGTPCRGSSYPAMAQGHYLPGDGPGVRCKLDDGTCADPDGDRPRCCKGMQQTSTLCPSCLAGGSGPRHMHSDGMRMWCPTCDDMYPVDELAAYFQSCMLGLREFYESEEAQNEKLREEISRVRAKLAEHEAMHAAMSQLVQGVSSHARLS